MGITDKPAFGGYIRFSKRPCMIIIITCIIRGCVPGQTPYHPRFNYCIPTGHTYRGKGEYGYDNKVKRRGKERVHDDQTTILFSFLTGHGTERDAASDFCEAISVV